MVPRINIAIAKNRVYTEAKAKARAKGKNYAEAQHYAETKAEAWSEATIASVKALSPLATDCLRLSMHFFYPIQQCAQQVYHTAIPLSPTSSQLQKSCLQTVIDNQLSQVTAFSGAPDTWGSLLRTIDVRPRQLTCIATTAQKIVVACEHIVHTYDAVTFVFQQSICAPETVTQICGSPDGSILFFEHYLSVTMWDVQTGGLIHTFTTQSEINNMAVSTTGNHVACSLSGGSIVFWNIHTKEEGKGFGDGQPVVSIYWLSNLELAVATQKSLYIRNVIDGETMGRFSVPGRVWGMVYLEDRGEFLVGTSQPSSRVGQGELSFFIRCQQPTLKAEELKLLRWKFVNLGQSPTHSGPLLSPLRVGEEVTCITPAGGAQIFNTRSYHWTNNPPLLGAATSIAVSLNRNLVVQTKDFIQIFSTDILRSGETHSGVQPSHIYPLGEKHIVCLLKPNRHLTILELETLRKLRRRDKSSLRSLLADQSAALGRGLVAEFGVSVVVELWRSGAPLPEWTEVGDKSAPLSGLSPKHTRVATVHSSPRREVRVQDLKTGKTLAKLPLSHDEFGAGEVYDLVFNTETMFYLKIDRPGWHVQIPHEIITSPSGRYSCKITRGEPEHLSEPRIKPPYTLDVNYEWVVDAESRKICWISPGNVRRGDGGHFWAGLSLVMVGDDGVVRKLTFKEPVL